MLLEEARFFIAFICALVSAYTDIRKGLIYDKVTYPMITSGLLFIILDVFLGEDPIVLLIPAFVFCFTYLLYYAGKIGGGDVKFLVGLSLLLPFYKGQPFFFNVVLVASLTSTGIISAASIVKFLNNKKKKLIIGKDFFIASILGLFLMFYFYLLYFVFNAISIVALALMSIPLFLSIIFLSFRTQIQDTLFLHWVNVDALEEDEIIAKEHLDTNLAKLFGGFKGVISEKDKKLLKRKGVKKVPVYRNLPPFAPFLLFGIVISYVFPDIFSALFLF
ncbi:MAG: A24 family peptidase [Candidatus Diapherotrites archaeon]